MKFELNDFNRRATTNAIVGFSFIVASVPLILNQPTKEWGNYVTIFGGIFLLLGLIAYWRASRRYFFVRKSLFKEIKNKK